MDVNSSAWRKSIEEIYISSLPKTFGYKASLVHLSIVPLGFSFFFKTRLQTSALQPWGKSTKCKVMLDFREWNLSYHK